MMLVQICASPTLRMCCATFPCGLRTDQKRRWYREGSASEIDRIRRQIRDGWKILVQRRQGSQHRQQGFRWSGLDNKPVAFLSHDHFLTPKFELTGDPHCLIPTVLKDFDMAFRAHSDLLWPMPSILSIDSCPPYVR